MGGAMKISLTKDLLSGVLFTSIGVGTVVLSQDYKLGTAANMGPAYFPIILGVVTALIGAVMLLKAVANPASSEPVPTWEVRPLIFVVAGLMAFSLLIDDRGLIVSVAVLIAMSRFAGHQRGLLELILMIVVLTALATAIFVYGLKIPLRLGPW
jgi:Tripartite tricarboxylate transporter TctB family